MDYAQKFTDKLQKHFIVVQWDQRETGKTLALNPSPEPLTFKLFEEDTRQLIDSLLTRFRHQKLFLAGHSWGTALGFYIAANYPEKLYAYLAVSPMINQLESERMLLQMMKEKAIENKDSTELRSLSGIHIPFRSGEELYLDRRGLFKFMGQHQTLRNFSQDYALQWSERWLKVWNEACAVNLQETLPEIKCPVYFFVGTKDFQTNFQIVERYYTQLKAPKKNLFKFAGAGHGIPTSRSDEFQKNIIEKILPEVYKK